MKLSLVYRGRKQSIRGGSGLGIFVIASPSQHMSAPKAPSCGSTYPKSLRFCRMSRILIVLTAFADEVRVTFGRGEMAQQPFSSVNGVIA